MYHYFAKRKNYVGYFHPFPIHYLLASIKLTYYCFLCGPKRIINLRMLFYFINTFILLLQNDFKLSGKLEVFPRKDFLDNKTQITCQDAGEDFQILCEAKLEVSLSSSLF